MNVEFIEYCFKSIKRRRKSILRTALSIFLAFTFVAGIMLFKSNMYQWQIESARHRFGNWIVMLYGSNLEENKDLKSHPYIDASGKASVDNYVNDNNNSTVTDIKVGYMTDEFIRIGNITTIEGHMPQQDDEVAIEEDTLVRLNQGSSIGQDITIDVYKDSSYNETIEKTYKLSGILSNYTNIWTGGENVPTVILTQNEGESINRMGKAAYIYSSSDYIRNNYADIYEGLQKKTENNLIYNSSLYDYEPWEGGYVYDYMYVILIVVGVSAVIYQMLMHERKRQDVSRILSGLGAKKLQVMAMSILENITIVAAACIAGLITSIITGWIICSIISRIKGITFFTVESSIYMYILIMFAVSVIASMIVSAARQNIYTRKPVMDAEPDKNKIAKEIRKKHSSCTDGRESDDNGNKIIRSYINKDNYIKLTYKRLRKTEGIISVAAVKVFSIAMLIIITGCIVNSVKVYRDYQNNTRQSDIIAFNRTDNNVKYEINCVYQEKGHDNEKEVWNRESLKNIYDRYIVISDYDIDKYVNNVSSYYMADEKYHFRSFNLSCNIKRADTVVYKAIDNKAIDYIESIDGVEDISYGYFETARMWQWDNQNLNKLGLAWYHDSDFNKSKFLKEQISEEKYLCTAEYVENDSDIYNGVLQNYIGNDEKDIEAFKNGEVSIVFIDKNPDGEYDDTLTAGMEIRLMKYQCNLYPIGNKNILNNNVYKDSSEYAKAINSYLNTYKSKDYQDDIYTLGKSELVDKYKDFYIKYMVEKESGMDEISEFINKSIEEQAYDITKYLSNNRINMYKYMVEYEPAATTKAVAVIQLNDEIKEQLKEYIPEFGQYTLLASDNLIRNALDCQNEMLRSYLELDELPDELKLGMNYNQIKLRYNISSLYNGTANTVKAYMEQTGWGYNSYSLKKDEVKRKTIEAFMLYGFTAAIAVCVYVMISVLVLNSRIERYSDTLGMLRNSGADRDVLFKIHMKGCISDTIWCIVLMPVMILIDIWIVKRAVKRL